MKLFTWLGFKQIDRFVFEFVDFWDMTVKLYDDDLKIIDAKAIEVQPL